MSDRYDAVVIGTGQAGPGLATRATKEGGRVAVVERHLVGGTCVNVGCTPTKALVGSARAIHMARRGDEFGFDIGAEPVVDMARVKERMEAIAQASNDGLNKMFDQNDAIELVRGHAKIDGPNRVVVGDRVLDTERIFVNVGARPRIPDLPGVNAIDYLTSSSILELDEVPDHLIIIGGSYVGLEFAQIHRRLGAQVTVIEQGPRLISREDPDVSHAIREMLEGEGVEFRLNAECIGFTRVDDDQPGSHPDRRKGRIGVDVDCADGSPQIVGSHLLLAVGRIPNTDDLGLDTVGVDTDEHGYITVDDQLRTSVDGIWAVGDCNGEGAFTHTSYNDHEILVANLFDEDPRRVSDRILCYGLFTDPPLGRVGMTESQARDSGRNVLIAKRPMKSVSRAIEMSETAGFMKFLVDADTHELLGGAIFGLNGDEVIHLIADVMYAKAPYTTISRAVHIHPTVSELVPTTLQNLEPLD
ncbi:FAD-containing oxidoreductase [Ilumatobacter sp.]|uniref:FAD-containing oxidoreductase n=1 Tax=Ilumatobacter sp. TaxID=1967498 RepID=UPI0037508CC0